MRGQAVVDQGEECGDNRQPVQSTVTYQGDTKLPTFFPWTVRFCPVPFHRGDTTSDGRLNITDAVSIFAYLFLNGEAPSCVEAADANDDGRLDIADGIYLLGFLFSEGQEPPFPGPPTFPCRGAKAQPAGFLGCESYGGC